MLQIDKRACKEKMNTFRIGKKRKSLDCDTTKGTTMNEFLEVKQAKRRKICQNCKQNEAKSNAKYCNDCQCLLHDYN